VYHFTVLIVDAYAKGFILYKEVYDQFVCDRVIMKYFFCDITQLQSEITLDDNEIIFFAMC